MKTWKKSRTTPRNTASSRVTRQIRFGALPLLFLFTGCNATPVGPVLTSIDETSVHPWASEAATRIDAHRVSLGCAPLRWHQQGATVAEAYAQQMSDEAFFGHVDPRGIGLKQRLNRAGITGYRIAAETIAAGQDYPAKVVKDWLESRDHRTILEDCQYTDIGLGFHEGDGPFREYWTAVFFASR